MQADRQSNRRRPSARLSETKGSNPRKWLFFAFLVFFAMIVTVPMVTGFPNGGSIPNEAGTVVETPALCASMPECHQFGSTLNQFGGVAFVNLPAEYSPGLSYEFGLQITGTAQTQLYGFQLAAFFQDDLRQAGSLDSETPGVEPIDFGGYQLLTHVTSLPSGSVAVSWTAPMQASGPVVFRVASNSANGNGSNTGDHINTLDAVVPAAQVVADGDGDGIDDAVEAAAPNSGDGNLDGTADRLQSHVASLPESVSSQFVTLAAPAGADFSDTASVSSPFPGDMPLGVEFSLGFWSFRLASAAAGVAFLSAGADNADAYFNYGPTPDDPTPHWYAFEFDGQTGAEFVDGRIVLHYRDGERGDHDLSVNGEISALGGPGRLRRILHFPQIALGVTGASEFQTELVFINTGLEDSSVGVEFFDSAGAPVPLSFLIGGVASGPAASLQRPLASGSTLRVLLRDAGTIQVGYARIQTDAGVGGTAVFSLIDRQSGEVFYQAGVPATAALNDFSLAAGVSPGTDTGLALVNASRGAGMTAAEAETAQVTLRLYDEDFNLRETLTIELEPGAHRPQFVTQFFPSLLNDEEFFGSVSVASTQPLAAVTLRQTASPTLTTFPVVPGRADSGN